MISDSQVIDAMRKYGGSFVQALADAHERADPVNSLKLKQTFSLNWKRYTDIASKEHNNK